MNNPDRSDSQDFELLQEINDICNRMTQVNLGQESVKEVMTELKSTLERKPRNNKRGYYQTIDCANPHYEEQVRYLRLSSDLNFTYFDRQYGEILKVPFNILQHFTPNYIEHSYSHLVENLYARQIT